MTAGLKSFEGIVKKMLYSTALSPLEEGEKLRSSVLADLAQRHKTESLRQLANKYGMSYEVVRRAIGKAKAPP